MAKLIYSAIASLDGYVADEEGNFDWSEPDDVAPMVVGGGKRCPPRLPATVLQRASTQRTNPQ
jgi:hypothetical protein